MLKALVLATLLGSSAFKATAQDIFPIIDLEILLSEQEERERILLEEIWPDFRGSFVRASKEFEGDKKINRSTLVDLSQFIIVAKPILDLHTENFSQLNYILVTSANEYCNINSKQFSGEKCLDTTVKMETVGSGFNQLNEVATALMLSEFFIQHKDRF